MDLNEGPGVRLPAMQYVEASSSEVYLGVASLRS